MSRHIEGQDRQQVTLLPECLDDFIAEDNPIRVVDALAAELDLKAPGFEGATPVAKGRPLITPQCHEDIHLWIPQSLAVPSPS
jgi:transposase